MRTVSGPTLACMISQRVPYDDAATPEQMASDCRAVNIALDLPPAAPQPQREVPDTPVMVSAAAAKFAGSFLE